MKIHKIILKDFLQFRDLEIDLTYPAGHPRAGQPLDRVCIIGQSGTGKTTLLRLVKVLVTGNAWVTWDLKIELNDERQRAALWFGDDQIRGENSLSLNGIVIGQSSRPTKREFDDSQQPFLISIPAEANLGAGMDRNAVPGDKRFFETELQNSDRLLDRYLERLKEGEFLDFNFQSFAEVGRKAFDQLAEYRARELAQSQVLKEAVLSGVTPEAIDQAKRAYQRWAAANPSPIEAVANACDPILTRFGVRIKRSLDEETVQSLGTLHLETLNGQHLPPSAWSTGSKHIFETATTLATIRPDGAVILIDEPEKSLYPDIQGKIVDFYSSLADNSQFFFATHSPIVASSFDPWEIVELKWSEDRQSVYQEQHFHGERHVDNFKFYPKYLKWDAILMKLFDLVNDGNMEFREEALNQAIDLEEELKAMKAKGDAQGAEFEAKVAKFLQLKSKLGW